MLTATTLRQLSHLDWIYEQGPVGTRVPVQPLLAHSASSGAPCTEDTLLVDLRELAATGWISLDETHDLGSTDCEMTSAGAGRLEHVRSRREDPVGRRRAARDALLRWVYERKVSGVHPPVISDFLTGPAGLFYGLPYPERDVNDASRHLKDRGLLTGTGSSGGGIIRPSITTAGEALVESGRSVGDAGPGTGPAAASYTISGDNNVIQAHSPHAHAAITSTITGDDRRQVLHLADVIEGALPALPAEAAALPASLRAAAAEGQDDPGVVRGALQNARTTLASGTGALVGNALLAGVSGVLAHFGVPLT
jgi:hypothetical protein